MLLYFAIVVDTGNTIKVFILLASHLIKLFPLDKATCVWKMTTKHLERYYQDPAIKIFEFKTETKVWWL